MDGKKQSSKENSLYHQFLPEWKSQGYITLEDTVNFTANMSEQEEEEFYEILRKNNIEIDSSYEEDVLEEDAQKENKENEVNPYTQYLKSISKHKVLTKEEEHELFTRYNNGDKSVRTRLINSNLKLVVSIAKLYKPPTNIADVFDIIQDGNIGLIKAVDKFDASKEIRFSTYATYWINQTIRVSFAKRYGAISVSPSKHAEIIKVNKYISKYKEENDSFPSIENISKAVGLSQKIVKNIIERKQDAVSLNAVVEDNDGQITEYEDLLPDKNHLNPYDDVVSRERHQFVEDELMFLNEVEAQVIRMRYGIGCEPMILEDIGKVLGFSRERVRQIQEIAEHNLRHSIPKYAVKAFLDK